MLVYAGGQIFATTSAKISELKKEQQGIALQGKLFNLLYSEEQVSESEIKRFLASKSDYGLQISSEASSLAQQSVGESKEKTFLALNRLNREILASSGLKSDSGKEAHFLVEVAYVQHPKLSRLIRLVHSNASFVVKEGRFTPDSYLALTDAENQAAQLIFEIEQNISILKYEKSPVATQLLNTAEALLDYIKVVKRRILDPDSIEMNISELNGLIRNANDATKTMRNIAIERVKESIDDRLLAQRGIQLFAFTLFVSLGFLAVYLLTSIAYSIRNNADKSEWLCTLGRSR